MGCGVVVKLHFLRQRIVLIERRIFGMHKLRNRTICFVISFNQLQELNTHAIATDLTAVVQARLDADSDFDAATDANAKAIAHPDTRPNAHAHSDLAAATTRSPDTRSKTT
jgi:hypothetical protein